MNLLEEAIAEAKTLREAAIVNAYKQLEENVTPAIKEALAQKLQEEEEIEDMDVDTEETLDETKNSGFKEVKPKKAVKEEKTEDSEEESDEKTEDEEKTEETEETEETETTEEESTEDETEETEETEEKEEITDDTPVEDLTTGDLKGIIADLIAQMSTEPAPEGDLGADMETADVEGAGEEDAPIEGAEEDVDVDIEDIKDTEDETEEEDEEIDLSELLKELEQEERDRKVTTHSQDKEDNCCNEAKMKEMKEELAKKDKELKEAKEALENIKSTLSEVNLLNAKLSYSNRTLSKPLNESQKLRVLKAFDAATSPKEVKLIYKTLNESLDAELAKSTTKVIKEHKGSASKFVGGAPTRGNIIETDPVVKRFQQLAGIIE